MTLRRQQNDIEHYSYLLEVQRAPCCFGRCRRDAKLAVRLSEPLERRPAKWGSVRAQQKGGDLFFGFALS